MIKRDRPNPGLIRSALPLISGMDLSPCLSESQDGPVLLALKVQPRASKDEVCGLLGHELKVKITAPPVDSAANQALLKFLAAALQCPRSSLTLRRGASSRHKTVAVTGLSRAEVAQRLDALLSP